MTLGKALHRHKIVGPVRLVERADLSDGSIHSRLLEPGQVVT